MHSSLGWRLERSTSCCCSTSHISHHAIPTPGISFKRRLTAPRSYALGSHGDNKQSHTSATRLTHCRSAAVEIPSQTVEVAIPRFPAPTPGAFSPDYTSFTEQHRIRGYEVQPDQRATIVTIANLLQEVAGNHAVGMWGRTDAGFANLPSMKELVFVMTRLQIRMFKYPKWGDIVNLETYFKEEGRLAARRDWKLTDAATGELLGAATSTWVTINMTTRRLSKLPDDLKERFMTLTPQFKREIIPAAETKKKLPDMDMENLVEGPQQTARRSDMDMNGHINNATYLAWCMETVPEDVYDKCKLYEIEIDFKAECKSGWLVDSLGNTLPAVQQEASSNGNGNGNGNGSSSPILQYLHCLRRCDEDGCIELIRARSSWKSA